MEFWRSLGVAAIRPDFVGSKRESSPNRARQIPLQIYGSAFAALGWKVRRMAAGKKSGKVKDCKMNSMVAGIDLGDRESLATVLSPIGDVADSFSSVS